MERTLDLLPCFTLIWSVAEKLIKYHKAPLHKGLLWNNISDPSILRFDLLQYNAIIQWYNNKFTEGLNELLLSFTFIEGSLARLGMSGLWSMFLNSKDVSSSSRRDFEKFRNCWGFLLKPERFLAKFLRNCSEMMHPSTKTFVCCLILMRLLLPFFKELNFGIYYDTNKIIARRKGY